MESKFAKTYETQRLIRRAFFEEYKIHCFNFILLLFESVIRILTTNSAPSSAHDEHVGDHHSKNYRRFLEHRQKKLD
jgi:hypothetical protein